MSPSVQQATQQQNLPLGAAALMAEIAIFVCMSVAAKFVAPEISLSVVLMCRYVFCLPLLFALGAYQRGAKMLHVTNHYVLSARILVGLCGLSTWFLSLAYIDIGLATVLGQTTAMFIALFGPMFGERRLGLHRGLALLFGFAGILVLTWDPQLILMNSPIAIGNSNFAIGVTASLMSAVFVAFMFLLLRKLGKSEAVISTALWYNLVGAVVFGAACLIFPVTLPHSPEVWALLIGIGICGSFQQYLMALSHKLASATALAPVHYSSVPMAILLGIFVFDEAITLNFILGTLSVVAAAYYIVRREQKFSDSQ